MATTTGGPDIISALPAETKDQVMEYLSDRDLASFRRTNRRNRFHAFPKWVKRCMQDKDDLPAILWAAKFGNEELLALLLAELPEANVREMSGTTGRSRDTPMSAASRNGSFEMVRALLEHDKRWQAKHGPSTDSWAVDISAALRRAAITEHHEVVRLLLESGANPQSKSFSDGSGILHLACVNGQTATLRAILDWKRTTSSAFPDIEGSNLTRATPLEAVLVRHLNILLNSDDGHGSGPHVQAVSSNLDFKCPESEDGTLSSGPWVIGRLSLKDRVAGLSDADLENLNESLKLDLPSGSNYRERILEMFEEPIQVQIRNPTLELGQILIDAGARSQVKDIFGELAIHPSDAMLTEDLELLYFLDSGGFCSVDSLRAGNGLSALQVLVCQRYVFPGSFLALALLETMGADMFPRHETGVPPPEQIARTREWPEEIIQMFLVPNAIDTEPADSK